MLSLYFVNDFICANKRSNVWNILANTLFSFNDICATSSGVSADTRKAVNDFLNAGSTLSHSARIAPSVLPAEYNFTALSTLSLNNFGAWNVTICPYVLFLSKIRFVLEKAWIKSCGPIGCLSMKIVDRHGASKPVNRRSTTITRSNCSFLLLNFVSFRASRLFKLLLYPWICEKSYLVPNIWL